MDLARIGREIVEAQRPVADRAYDHLCAAARDGSEIALSDNELVRAIQKAIWEGELATAWLGLSELELRTAMTTVHRHERDAA